MTTEGMSETPKCEICGEQMPAGEEMFKYHGYSGDCPKPPLPKSATPRTDAASFKLGSLKTRLDTPEHTVVDSDFARTLERELAEAKRELETLRGIVVSSTPHAHIMRLERELARREGWRIRLSGYLKGGTPANCRPKYRRWRAKLQTSSQV